MEEDTGQQGPLTPGPSAFLSVTAAVKHSLGKMPGCVLTVLQFAFPTHRLRVDPAWHTQLRQPHAWEGLWLERARCGTRWLWEGLAHRSRAAVSWPSPSLTICTDSNCDHFGSSSCICWDKICTAVEIIKMKNHSGWREGIISQMSTEYSK